VGLNVLIKPQPAQAVKWLRIALAATASADGITGEEDDTFAATPDALNPRGGLKAAAKPSFLKRNSSNGRAAAVVNGSFVGPCIGDDGLAVGSMFAIADQLGTAAEAALAAARSEFDAAAEEEGKVRQSDLRLCTMFVCCNFAECYGSPVLLLAASLMLLLRRRGR
jgi:hypothetical protein